MPSKAFLVSNVFIFGFERPRSNSRRILDFLVGGEVHGVVTDRVVRVVIGYMRRYHGKDLAGKLRDLILLTCDLLLEEDLPIDPELYAMVGAKDAGALAAVRSSGLSRLVSTDSDFVKVPEHRTPREYLQELNEPLLPGGTSDESVESRGGSRRWAANPRRSTPDRERAHARLFPGVPDGGRVWAGGCNYGWCALTVPRLTHVL